MSFHSTEGSGYNMKIMEEKFGDDELQKMMKGNGIVCNFGWLVAQAHNQGKEFRFIILFLFFCHFFCDI